MLCVCPICGGSLSDHVCVKCGYRPVKQDEDAFARWREHILLSQNHTTLDKDVTKSANKKVKKMGPNRLFLILYVIAVFIWGFYSISEAMDSVLNQRYKINDVQEQESISDENGRTYEEHINFDF